MQNKMRVNIATPVAWASSGIINHFSENMSKLIDKLNNASQSSKASFEIEKAVIDVLSATRNEIVNSSGNIDIKCFDMSIDERINRGMAHWWFTSVRRAFDLSPSVESVLYYPIDVCWDDSIENTVANPIKIYEMLNQLSQKRKTELLVIGNYESSNENKEKIEEEVRFFLKAKFPNLNEKIIRVRSEFWAINRKLFDDFEKECVKNTSYPNIADPSLLLILYCLGKKKTIIAYDLGRYKVEGEWNTDKQNEQIKRARKLINDFVDGKYC